MADRNPEDGLTIPREEIPGLPQFGWRVSLDYKCDEKCKPFQAPRLSQIVSLAGLGLRYWYHMTKCRLKDRRPHMDYTNPVPHNPIYGCPIGGIGTGTVGRGYRGEFCRFQMVPGMYENQIVQADSFIVCIRKNNKTVYQKVLTGQRTKKSLSTWDWSFPRNQGTYQALYPRAWTVYNIPECSVRLICRQISPIIPHDYKDSSFPMSAFIWTIENNGTEELDISITFTFKNGTGSKKDSTGGCQTKLYDEQDIRCVAIGQSLREMSCTYGLAVHKKEGVQTSHCLQFDPEGHGGEIWGSLSQTGQLNSSNSTGTETPKGQDVGVAICQMCSSKPGSSQTLEFALVWDMPLVHFRSKAVQYTRRYTQWFGSKCDAVSPLASYCLKNYAIWEEKIDQWQAKVLNCSALPSWYKSLLFNELYFVSDGGTVWLDLYHGQSNGQGSHSENNDHPLVKKYGKFAYLEGQEYRMYNTYDVHFYASFALIMLWPKIQLSLQYDMAKAVKSEHHEPIRFCMGGVSGVRKVSNTVPHDIGDPEDEPWVRLNAYNIHPTDNWKDLNLKFILQVYRDYHATEDRDYLDYMYPITKLLIDNSLRWDVDKDGLIENGGFADQTYDAWIVHGASAYCGGLWLCSLRMFLEMAKILNKDEDVGKYQPILDKAKESYDIKLWNGEYYNYDCSTNGTHDSIMADQLAGNWWLRASGIEDHSVFPPEKVKKALETVFKFNVMGFANGNIGAINGTRPDGKKDITSCQSEEFWIGVTYGLAAQMIQEGMLEEGFKTAWGNYNVCWEWLGLMFQSPEAYMTTKHFRSLSYMRALAIWSMQWALEKYHPHLFND